MRDFVRMAFKAVEIQIEFRGAGVAEQGVDARTGKTLVTINPRFYRPAEVDLLIGTRPRPNPSWDGSRGRPSRNFAA